MSSTITLSLSGDDRRQIVVDVVAALKPLLEKQTAPMLVDADELARLLSLSRPTIDRLRAAGVIPSIGQGRLRRFDPDAAITALAAHREKGEAESRT